MRRGDLVVVAIPGDFGKPRPALVIQSDGFAMTGTVTVLLISGTLVDAPLIRLNVQPALCAMARASIVFATPGTSSMSRWPSAKKTAMASTTCSCLPTTTFSTLAMSCRAMPATSAVESPFGSSMGDKVTFGFLSGCNSGNVMPAFVYS